MQHDYKLSLGCQHIMNCKAPMCIEIDEHPLHKSDSGKTYVCEKCFKKDILKIKFDFFHDNNIQVKFN